jgi:outer membrane protein assembly factor BamB
MLRWIVIAVLAMPALPLQGAQPQFWKIEGAGDFLAGEIEGLAVDSDGHVRLAPAARALHDPAAPFVWCLAADAKGRIFAGTGSDGKVFRIDAGQGALFFDAAELEVHALAAGPDGKLYVGTSPDGKVYSVDEQGHGSVFFDLTDKYI